MAQKMAVQRARAHIRNSRKSREDVIFEYIVYIILALISLIIIYPLWFVLIASFSEAKLVVAGKVLWRPVGLTLDNYAECFKNGDLMIGYKNSLGILFLGTATNLVLTTLCAYPLSRRDLWGKNAIMMYATFPMFFSGGMIPTYLLVARTLGLSNSWWAVILVGGIATYNMDPDIFTDTFAQLITKCTTGRTLTYCFVNNSPVSGAYEDQTVPMTEPLEGYNGEKMWSNFSMPASQSANFCITNKCPEEYREIMARWADYFYSVEGIVAYFMGQENESYTYDPETDEYTLTDKILKDPDGRNFEQVQSQWCTWAGGMNPSCATNELFKGGETWPVSLESAAGLINYTPDAVGGAVWAPFVFDPDTASRISVLTADFDTYLDEWAGNFITGKKDVDNDWDEYVNGFNALNVEEYLGYINAKIDEKGL